MISLVELGVLRDVEVEGGASAWSSRRRSSVARRSRRCATGWRRRSELGGEAEVEVVDRRLVVDRQDHPGGPGEAARRRLRAARPARGRARPSWCSCSEAFRCPYCGSTETKLENIFGPTPCRSIRYCAGCSQPFEQFKTI